ncbi:hypothetical protein OM076_44260, partial [Solirubrobacter ginsenosidimutans]
MSELAVILGDLVAGTLTRLRGGRLRSDYADDYRAGTPLPLSVPVQVRSHASGVVVPWLSPASCESTPKNFLRGPTISRSERPTHSLTPL